MLTSNKKILIIFLFLILISTKTFAVVKPTTDFYVNDYAGLLNTQTKQYIINTNKDLNTKTGAQIVVVTVNNLENSSLEDYATKIFREFGIGDKEKNNGVLLLLALEERQFRVEVGYGLEGALPDAKTGRIQDEYIIPYLKQHEWDEGIKNGYSAILEIVANEYKVEIDTKTPVKGEIIDSNTQSTISIIAVVCGGLIGILKRFGAIKFRIVLILSGIFIIANIIAYNFFTLCAKDDIMVSIIANIVFFFVAMLGVFARRTRRDYYRRLFWWWKNIRRRRLFRWRRKLKKFLAVSTC